MPGAAGTLDESATGSYCLAVGQVIDVFLHAPTPAQPWSPIASSHPEILAPQRTGVLTAPVGLYGGYFGAAAGVLMLAVLTLMLPGRSLARTNAVKNVAIGAANTAASVVFVTTGPVRWAAAVALAAGSLVGGWLGPSVVRRVPAGPLRLLIALGGLGLAVKLAKEAGLC